jgi:hypothetical protein
MGDAYVGVGGMWVLLALQLFSVIMTSHCERLSFKRNGMMLGVELACTQKQQKKNIKGNKFVAGGRGRIWTSPRFRCDTGKAERSHCGR